MLGVGSQVERPRWLPIDCAIGIFGHLVSLQDLVERIDGWRVTLGEIDCLDRAVPLSAPVLRDHAVESGGAGLQFCADLRVLRCQDAGPFGDVGVMFFGFGLALQIQVHLAACVAARVGDRQILIDPKVVVFGLGDRVQGAFSDLVQVARPEIGHLRHLPHVAGGAVDHAAVVIAGFACGVSGIPFPLGSSRGGELLRMPVGGDLKPLGGSPKLRRR
jgi:hypothetical protein